MVVNIYWICSIVKIYIICCVSTQILYWVKSCSWGIGQNPLSQSDYRIFKTIFPEQIDETGSFFSWLKVFWFGMVKNYCGQSGLWTLKLTVSEEWTDGTNWFFACWHKFMQINRWLKIFEVGIVKIGCGQSGDRTLKNEQIGMTIFFACWYRFTKIKNWSIFFWGVGGWVGGHGHYWVWPVWSWDSKIECIPKMNRWNKLIFCMLAQIQGS